MHGSVRLISDYLDVSAEFSDRRVKAADKPEKFRFLPLIIYAYLSDVTINIIYPHLTAKLHFGDCPKRQPREWGGFFVCRFNIIPT